MTNMSYFYILHNGFLKKCLFCLYIRLAFYLDVGAEDATIMSLLQNAGLLSIHGIRFYFLIFGFYLWFNYFFLFKSRVFFGLPIIVVECTHNPEGKCYHC